MVAPPLALGLNQAHRQLTGGAVPTGGGRASALPVVCVTVFQTCLLASPLISSAL